MSFLSFPKLVVLGLGIATAAKLSAVLIPMTADAEPGEAAPASSQIELAAAVPQGSYEAPASNTNGICETSVVIAAAITEERSLLDAQREAMADREAGLALAEQSLKVAQDRLARTRDELEVQLTLIEKANAQDMTKLVELYSNMKPQVAAGIMDEIDMETAVQVITAMSERDAAQIMGAFSLVRARAITRIILERSKLPADRNLEGLRLR